MLRNTPGRRTRRGPLVLTTVLAGALTTSVVGFPAVASANSDRDFSVEKLTGGGWRVVLELDEPLPVRNAVPELAVDGEVIGAARESADGKRLTVETSDPVAASASDVEVAFNGVVPSAATTAPRGAAAPVTPRGLARKQLSVDPATPGPYTVERADYDLGDTATTLSGLSDLPVEVRAAVYLPAQARGPRPVVVFLHGRHAACYHPVTRGTNNTNWPCAAGFQPIESHLGYTETAEALATHGYAVVSISANGINAKDASSTDDNGGLARGQLVMHHLDLLSQWTASRGTSPLSGRLDLTDVGMMGHSRGGEGVVEAALLNAARAKPYGVKAVLPLAPVDFARATLPDVPMAVVLPYCDGDVSNQQGQHFYDDTRYSAEDDVLRSSLMVMGANHNFFNTEWTPGVSVAPSGDDWAASAASDEVCGSAGSPTRLTAAEQRAVGTAYMAGFFRLVQGGETQFLSLFDGTNGTVPSTGRAVVFTQAQQPGSRREDVAPLEAAAGNVSLTGFRTAAYCSAASTRAPAAGTACSSTTLTSKLPHWTPATYASWVPLSPVLRVQWDAATSAAEVRVDLADSNVKKYEALTFRAARDDEAVGDVDLAVTVTDGKGRSSRTLVSSTGPALTPLPSSTNTTNGRNLLGKTWLRTVRIPTAGLAGVDLTDVRTVTFTPATPTGGAYLSDVAFDSTGVGRGAPTGLPQISVLDTAVAEGDGPGTATVQLELDRALKSPATVNLQAASSGSAAAGQVPAQWIPVSLPKGATSAIVTVPLAGNTVVNAAASRYKINVSSPVNAVIGDGFAWLTVQDDDSPAG